MIAVLAAMAEELAPLRGELAAQEVYTNKVVKMWRTEGERPLLLVQSGIGKANAAAAAAIVIERFAPRALINIGSAGGFAPHVKVGDVVVGTEALYSDVDATCFNYRLGQVPQMPPVYPGDPALLAAAKALAAADEFAGRVAFGPILTSDSFMSDPARVAGIMAAFPQAFASDMEGAAIAEAAYQCGVPFLNVRSMSDIAGDEAARSFDENLELAAARAAEFFRRLAAAISA